MRYFIQVCLLLLAAITTQAQNAAPTDPKVITGMVLLNEKKVPDFNKISEELPQNWYVKVDSLTISGKTMLFSTSGATVMLAYLDYPVNPEEIQIASGISWLWKTAAKETSTHKAQLVISVLGPPSKTLELYRIFTRVAAGAMAVQPSASGIYMNSQYLLLSKGYYNEVARNMSRDGLPLYCWVYFGLLEQNGLSNGYSYGLSEFGQPELEIVNSKMSLQDSHTLLYEVAQKAVAAPAKWKDGEQVDLPEGRKVTIRISTAKVIREDIQTMKIE